MIVRDIGGTSLSMVWMPLFWKSWMVEGIRKRALGQRKIGEKAKNRGGGIVAFL